jgi:hypothetical protein
MHATSDYSITDPAVARTLQSKQTGGPLGDRRPAGVRYWSRDDASPRYEHIEAFPQGAGSAADVSYRPFA